MTFTTRLDLPILKTEVRYNGFNNLDYLNILKFITNNDNAGLSNYLEYILKSYIDNEQIYNNITNIEKFLILLDMRVLSLGDQIQFKTKNDILVKSSLISIKNIIINKIKVIDWNEFNIFKYNNIEVKLSIPKKLNILTLDQVWRDVVESIQIEDDIIYYNNLTELEKEEIESLLPANFGMDIMSFINITQYKVHTIDIIKENISIGLDHIPLNLYDNTLFMFIKSILSDNLMNIYELEYVLTTKLHLSYDRFSKMSPNESRIFINFYNREQKEAQDAQKSSDPKFNKK